MPQSSPKGLTGPPSYTGVRRFFERFDATNHNVVVFMREGDKAYIDTAGSYLTRDDKILEVGDVLVADSHKMNFMMINPETGKPSRFTLVGWQDWASRMFMGFEIMLNENTQVIASSLHNMCLWESCLSPSISTTERHSRTNSLRVKATQKRWTACICALEFM